MDPGFVLPIFGGVAGILTAAASRPEPAAHENIIILQQTEAKKRIAFSLGGALLTYGGAIVANAMHHPEISVGLSSVGTFLTSFSVGNFLNRAFPQ